MKEEHGVEGLNSTKNKCDHELAMDYLSLYLSIKQAVLPEYSPANTSSTIQLLCTELQLLTLQYIHFSPFLSVTLLFHYGLLVVLDTMLLTDMFYILVLLSKKNLIAGT